MKVPGSLLLSVAVALSACSSPRVAPRVGRSPGTGSGSVPVSASDGGQAVEANWKERIEQPYLYLEHLGDYRDLGEAMRGLFAQAAELSLEPDGAPFALFYDDPGRTAADELRARVCLPVSDRPSRTGSLRFDILPRAMVVYARVRGAYPEVARSYPALFRYLQGLGWRPGGPVREVYLVNPAEVAQYDELLTEVQIPWTAPAE